MQPLITAVSSWFLNQDEDEQRFKIMYVKSLFYMILIVLLVCNFFFGNTVSEIKNLFGDTIIKSLSLFLTIGLHFFTVLSAISLTLFIISAILDKIHDELLELEKDNSFTKLIKSIYFGNLIYGSFNRFKDSLEDITIFLIAAYLLDNNVFMQYKSIYDESLWTLLLIVMSLVFIVFSLTGIVNRFFKLKSYIMSKEELPPQESDNYNLKSELFSLKAMNQNLEKEILSLEGENMRLREKLLILENQESTKGYI
ncbi:TPA: hypothetical protein KQG29_001485 [Clostridioides difficile]|nr:hypothetical protein [Clostridioides difficile]